MASGAQAIKIYHSFTIRRNQVDRRFRCLFGSFGEEHELVARNRSKKNEQKTSEP